MYSSTLFLTSALEGGEGQRHDPAAPYPRERPGTHCTGGWVGIRAGLDRCGKSRPPPEIDPRTVQPVGSCCTDYGTRPTKPDGKGAKVSPFIHSSTLIWRQRDLMQRGGRL